MAALRGSCSPTLFKPAETYGRVNNVPRDSDANDDLMASENELVVGYRCVTILDSEGNKNWLDT